MGALVCPDAANLYSLRPVRDDVVSFVGLFVVTQFSTGWASDSDVALLTCVYL